MCCHNDIHCHQTRFWLNGMANPRNLLARGEADDDPDNIAFYGDDTEYSPFEYSDNNVQVFLSNISDRNGQWHGPYNFHIGVRKIRLHIFFNFLKKIWE